MIAEEVARETALALVGVYSRAGTPHDKGEQGFTVCGVEVACRRPSEAEGYARGVTDALAKAVLAAIERVLREVPVPSPVSGERLAHVREQNAAQADEWGHSAETLVIDQLLAHADHLTRLLQDAAADGTLSRMQELREAGRREGFREGAAAQRALDVEAARSQLTGWGADCEDCVTGVSVAAQAVADAPLAGPPAG